MSGFSGTLDELVVQLAPLDVYGRAAILEKLSAEKIIRWLEEGSGAAAEKLLRFASLEHRQYFIQEMIARNPLLTMIQTPEDLRLLSLHLNRVSCAQMIQELKCRLGVILGAIDYAGLISLLVAVPFEPIRTILFEHLPFKQLKQILLSEDGRFSQSHFDQLCLYFPARHTRQILEAARSSLSRVAQNAFVVWVNGQPVFYATREHEICAPGPGR